MIQNKKLIFVFLLIPIVSLLTLICYREYRLRTGYEATFPIYGYDPRDLLSGHYLTFQIQFDAPELCSNPVSSKAFQPFRVRKTLTYICLDDRKIYLYQPPKSCHVFIKGFCHYNRFETGVERYYIPENKATELQKQINNKNASIVLSISPNGQAQIKDLLIDGKPWRNLK